MMKQEIDKAIDYCIEALNNHQDGTQYSYGNDLAVLETINKLYKLPYSGRNLGIGEIGYREYRSNWKDFHQRFDGKKNITYSLDWLTAILLLYDFADYNEMDILKSAQKITQDDIIYNHIMIHIISNLVVKNDIVVAEKIIPNFRKTKIFRESDNQDDGYLIILKYYSSKGDSVNFFKYFKLCKPAINKYEVNECKSVLISQFTKINGIGKAINLCAHKNLGIKFHYSALSSFAEEGYYQELKKIFEEMPELKQPESQTELATLTSAYLKAKEKNIAIDDDFNMLFERTLEVDRKLKWGDCKLQDSIFLDLGLASYDNLERVKKCRKAIKNNSLKRELLIK